MLILSNVLTIPTPLEVDWHVFGLSLQTLVVATLLLLLLLLAARGLGRCAAVSVSALQRPWPPHVPGWPLIGNVLDIDAYQPHVTLTSMAERYGDVYTVRVLRERIVVVSGADLVREALTKQGAAIAGRPPIFRIDYGFHYTKDVIFGNYSPRWCQLKKAAAQALRMFGTGVRHVDEVVRDELAALNQSLEGRRGQAFDPRVTLMTAVVNALTASVIGQRYDHEDRRMKQYKLTTRLFSETCSPSRGMELDLFPWLRFFGNTNFKKLTYARSMLDKLIDEELQSAKERYDPDSVRCVLDVLFKMQEQVAVNNNDDGEGLGTFKLEDSDVRNIFIDLLVSGTFTTAISLSTFVILMMNFPDMQKELRLLVNEQIGRQRAPSAEDRQRLPAIESLVLELLRYLSHVPLSLPHFTTQDATLGSYGIPEGTKVLLNFWAVHHDPRIWKDPWKFNYKRFLTEDGNLIPPTDIRRKCLIPFGGGKRMCLGETMARERLFLFITSLLQQFDFRPPEGEPLASPDPRDFDLGLILEPKPFLTCAVPNLVES